MDVLGEISKRRLVRHGQADKRYMIVSLMVVALLLLVVSRHSAEASVFEKARESVTDAAAPVLNILSGPIKAIGDAIGSVQDYFGVIEENRMLKEEQAELLQWKAEALRLRDLLSKYDRLLSLEAPPEIAHVQGHVVGESNGPFLRAMIVNVGADQDIERGQAVIDDYGLVGHVVTAGRKASRILLLTDLNSRIPVYIEEADIQAILGGRYDEAPRLEFLDTADLTGLAEGQRVLTSGRGGVLPRGLPVGVIGGIGEDGATVELYSDYDRTDVVSVLRYDFPTDVTPVETPFGELNAPSAEGAGDAAALNAAAANG
ncbi:MAG: rod shape-determining protein MreC [Pseudomonadota bacterium]